MRVAAFDFVTETPRRMFVLNCVRRIFTGAWDDGESRGLGKRWGAIWRLSVPTLHFCCDGNGGGAGRSYLCAASRRRVLL